MTIHDTHRVIIGESGGVPVLDDPLPGESVSLEIGQRVVASHPTMGRDYATVAGPGTRADTVMLYVEGRFYNPQEWPRSLVQATTAQRDMVPGDLLDLGTLKMIFERPFLGTLWTEGDSGILTPYVCECTFGDGQKLIRISTINQRPNYHVVRVDSRWKTSSWADGEVISDHIDEILSAIEEECGRAGQWLDEPCDSCRDTCCRCGEDYSADQAFPALDDENGCSWSEVSWRWLMRQIGLTA
jgi:hypothetical protein